MRGIIYCKGLFISAIYRLGSGACELLPGSGANQQDIIQRQIWRALQPNLSNVNIEWKIYSDDPKAQPIQVSLSSLVLSLLFSYYSKKSPRILGSIFKNDRVLVYAMLSEPCTRAILRASVQGKEVSSVVNTHEVCILRSKLIVLTPSEAVIHYR